MYKLWFRSYCPLEGKERGSSHVMVPTEQLYSESLGKYNRTNSYWITSGIVTYENEFTQVTVVSILNEPSYTLTKWAHPVSLYDNLL